MTNLTNKKNTIKSEAEVDKNVRSEDYLPLQKVIMKVKITHVWQEEVQGTLPTVQIWTEHRFRWMFWPVLSYECRLGTGQQRPWKVLQHP